MLCDTVYSSTRVLHHVVLRVLSIVLATSFALTHTTVQYTVAKTGTVCIALKKSTSSVCKGSGFPSLF
jgi:hypothetical protein